MRLIFVPSPLKRALIDVDFHDAVRGIVVARCVAAKSDGPCWAHRRQPHCYRPYPQPPPRPTLRPFEVPLAFDSIRRATLKVRSERNSTVNADVSLDADGFFEPQQKGSWAALEPCGYGLSM